MLACEVFVYNFMIISADFFAFKGTVSRDGPSTETIGV
jgi:hypothetical protein